MEMKDIIKKVLQDALQGIFPTGSMIQLDNRVALHVGQAYDSTYAYLTYKGKSVHDYTVDGQVYDRYLFDNETLLEGVENHSLGLPEQLLHDLKKYAKRG